MAKEPGAGTMHIETDLITFVVRHLAKCGTPMINSPREPCEENNDAVRIQISLLDQEDEGACGIER